MYERISNLNWYTGVEVFNDILLNDYHSIHSLPMIARRLLWDLAVTDNDLNWIWWMKLGSQTTASLLREYFSLHFVARFTFYHAMCNTQFKMHTMMCPFWYGIYEWRCKVKLHYTVKSWFSPIIANM